MRPRALTRKTPQNCYVTEVTGWDGDLGRRVTHIQLSSTPPPGVQHATAAPKPKEVRRVQSH